MSITTSEQQSIYNSTVENVCAYDIESNFDNEEIELQRKTVSKYIVDDDFQNVVLAIYSMDKKQDVKEISLKVNAMIEYTTSKKMEFNFETYVQVYEFGNEYFDFLNAKGVNTNLEVAKEFQKEKNLDSETYRYAVKALSNLNSDCSFNDSGMPIKKPYTISGWYPTYGKDGSGYKHVGIDFAVPINTPMYAIKDSEVISIGTTCPVVGSLGNDCGANGISGAGNYVMLKFKDKKDTYYISYMHLTTPNVSVGDSVLKGQLVAYSGSSGNSSGAHCHVEIHKNAKTITDIGIKSKTSINPCEYIKGLCE